MTLHEALVRVKEMVDNKEATAMRGICFLLERVNVREGCKGLSEESYEQLYELIKQWPKYSGNSVFPVPDPEGKLWPGFAFNHHRDRRTLWKGSYGKLRRELLDFLIEETRSDK